MANLFCGIDLGTTYSCIGTFENNKVEILANESGSRTTPSWVSFDEERLVGDAAKANSVRNPKNTVFDAKRLMGKPFDDKKLQSDLKNLPYTVINKDNKPVIEVEFNKEKKQFTPEQISAMVLEKMKVIGEQCTGEKLVDCVITVPAYFNDAQRQATKDAGLIAGMNVLRIINEPTAAAIAYGLDKMSEGDDKNILVFDFGGGTMDCSILNISDGVFEVLSTAGDTHLGGEDIDNILIQYCIQEFEKKNRDKKISNNEKVRSRLHRVCEQAKRTLSSSTTAMIEVDCLFDGIDFSLTLTRARFEDLCGEIFRKTMDPVSAVLKDAKLGKNQIDEIVLVGGSTRIPKIQSLLKDYFNGKNPNNTINPDECVAYGATIQAAVLSGVRTEQTDNILLLDCTPLSLGIETSGEISTVLIPRGTTIPAKKTQTFSTYEDNQPQATIKVLEGERYYSRDNNVLGTFVLQNIPPAPRGTTKINVCYDISADGLLNVSAEVENAEGVKNSLVINNDKNRLTKEEIDRMMKEAEDFREEDEKNKENRDALNTYEETLYLNMQNIKEQRSDSHLVTMYEEELSWIKSNPRASKEEVETRRKEFDEKKKQFEVTTTDDKQETDTKAPEEEEEQPQIDEVD
jgi:L1 cell adhesion molecule like protein